MKQKKKTPIIYTVCVKARWAEKEGIFQDRVIGWYESKKEAIAALQEYGSECYYDTAVIESFKPGTYSCAETETWFKWMRKSKKWIEIVKPKSLRHFVNFAIG